MEAPPAPPAPPARLARPPRSRQLTAQVKLAVLFPDITLTNCWKVMAEVEPEYLDINMSTSILSTSNPPHHLLVCQINQVFSFPQGNLIFELLLIDDDKKF